jgi:Cys-tRNA(Pro)/Cys-tRNA(Cys) deacylase
MLSPAEEFLKQRGIPYRIFFHQGVPDSLAKAAQERGHHIEQVVRSILFRLDEVEFVMVLVAGGRQVHWPTLRRYLGRQRLTLASDEEVVRVTGYLPGSVSPFGLSPSIRVLVDPSALVPEEISLGSGKPGVALILRSKYLLQALGNCEVVNLSVNENAPGESGYNRQ